MHCKRFIFTGTPGSGKTSVIQELEKQGYSVIHETATDVIADAQLNGMITPWEDPHFIEAIIYCQNERQVNATGDLQFFDRSPFCTYALADYLGHAPSAPLKNEIERCLREKIYQTKVFFFENLGFIEHTDARKISFEDALTFEQIHLDIYKSFGFDIKMAPKSLTVDQRCEFILENA